MYTGKSSTTVEGVPRIMSPEKRKELELWFKRKDMWSEMWPGVWIDSSFRSSFDGSKKENVSPHLISLTM